MLHRFDCDLKIVRRALLVFDWYSKNQFLDESHEKYMAKPHNIRLEVFGALRLGVNLGEEAMMGRLVRLVYVSRACVDIDKGADDIDPEICDILKAARVHNRKHNIGGVLYLGDGYFFQCLEGREARVYELFDKIKQDRRHQSLKISYCRRVRRRMFKSWSMKYVPVSNEIKELIQARGYNTFTPTHFDESDINAIIDLFVHSVDTSLESETLREAYFLRPAWWERFFGLRLTHH